MPTFSLTTPNENIREQFKANVKRIIDENPDVKTQADALGLAFKAYFEGVEYFYNESRREPSSVQKTIEKIACNFLKFEDYEFKCFERFDERKKPDNLGTEPDKILIRCEGCKEGKAKKILEQYQKKLRGQNIRGILQMIRTFESFAEKGVPSTIHFCNRIRGKQVITGTKMISCTKHDMKVPIDPTCIDPQCPHYEKYTIVVDQEFPKQTLALIEGIAEDYKRIEDLSPNKPKDVDSEVIK